MKPGIGQEVKKLRGMKSTELHEKCLEVLGEETHSWNKEFLLFLHERPTTPTLTEAR